MGVDIQTYRAKIGTYRHNFGTDVATCVIVINFSQSLKYIGSVLFIGILLMMAGIEPNPGPKDCADDKFDKLKDNTTIKVTGLPENVTDETLVMFFENERRQGGGEVNAVSICERDGYALVTFKNKTAVETVLNKKPIIFLGQEIQVESYVPAKIALSNLEVSKLFVAWLPSNVTEETLTMFFENERRQGGGTVLKVTLNTENQTAVVEFENPEAVCTVLQKRPIIISGQEVKIDIFDPQKQQSPALEPSKLFVAGLPSNVTEETLTMFFENERKQGGGVVLNVTIDTENQTAVVEFENPKAVKTVLQKRPIQISGKEVQVDIFAHERSNNAMEIQTLKIRNVSEESAERSRNENDIQTECEEDQDKHRLLESVTQHHEGNDKVHNQMKSKNLEIEKQSKEGTKQRRDEDNRETLQSDTAENRGPGQVHNQMTLENLDIEKQSKEDKKQRRDEYDRETKCEGNDEHQTLQSDTLKDKVPPKKPSSTLEPTKLFVAGIHPNVTEETLTDVFENERRQGGGAVLNVSIDRENQTAVVEFEHSQGVKTVLQKRPITVLGKEVTVGIFVPPKISSSTLEPTKLSVAGLPQNVTEETLTDVFENERRQGGGAVLNVSIDRENQTAVVEFEHPQGVKTVLQKRPITVLGKEVTVGIFVPPKISSSTLEPTKLSVAGLPQNVTEETLTDVFENERRQGGGAVLNVSIDRENQTAVVEFEHPQGVKTVLQKRPITVLGKEVTVGIFAVGTVLQKRPTTVLGKQVQVDRFAVSTVLQKRPITIWGKTVEVDIFDPELHQFETAAGQEQRAGTNLVSKRRDMPLLDFRRSLTQMEFQNTAFAKLSKDDTEQRRYEQDVDNKCEEGNDKHQTLQTDTQENKGHEKDHNEMKSMNLEIEKQSKEGTKHLTEEGNKDTKCDGGNDKHETLQSDSMENKGHEKGHIDMKSKNLEVEKQSKEGTKHLTEEGNKDTKCDGGNDKHETLQSDSMENKGYKEFIDILQILGLVDKYPAKITMNDAIAVNPDEAAEYDKQVIPLTDVPWVMLKRLMCAHSEARDIIAKRGNTEEKQNDYDLFNLEVDELENDALSPLDMFTVVFQCCDPFLKLIVFQKLFLCKMAVPFLYKTWNQHRYQQVLSIWPLRSLTIENKLKSSAGSVEKSETDVLHFNSKIMTFCRFGRPRYSKSKLLNSLLTIQGSKTFFHVDCPSGMAPRHLSNGQVEMFWLPLVGSKIDKFKDPMTFMNMRGDIGEHFSSETRSFIAKITDALLIITDFSYIQGQSDMLKRVLSNFQSAILIIANPLGANHRQLVSNFETDIKSSGTVANFRVLCTHKGTIERNVIDMVKYISYNIESHLISNKLKTLSHRLKVLIGSKVISDEDDKECQRGKVNAEELLKLMKSNGKNLKEWKQNLTPVHSKYSKHLGKLRKKRERVKDLGEGEILDREIANIQQKQTQAITKTTEKFIRMLITNAGSGSSKEQDFFLRWLHYFIEREKRGILPQLILKNHYAMETLDNLKSNNETNPGDIRKQEEILTQSEKEIEDASFSVEHLFREIGHIYEAFLHLNLNAMDYGLPMIDTIAKIVGHIVANGHQFELIDGESFYMPFKWIKEVMKNVESITNSCKVMVLSVLGLQSSGKSTLLNTMFGSQFLTRTGRCTRGIHIQLVPTKVSKLRTWSFDYVVVVDTEGLRSPELSQMHHEHDNELATVITGLGDVTLLNIMGENTNEIKDILQVIVHAFLRLKMTNQSLDLKKSCTFIHQNVTDISASENMRKGLKNLLQTLDAMTEESAKSEGIIDITTFNQVIEFDTKSQVWYLKNLWQGNPPMARVNYEYSELVVDIKCKILKKALSMNEKSSKLLCHVIEQAHSLWKGVMNEDFVFSFRNSLEIRAYIEMDKVVQENLWRLEIATRERLVEKAQSRFADIIYKEKLSKAGDNLIRELKDYLKEEKNKVDENIANYFERNKYKDLTIQWKTTQKVRIDTLCQTLEKIIFEHVEKIYIKRSIEILTVSSHKQHEEELRRMSMKVAAENKGRLLSRDHIDELFEGI